METGGIGGISELIRFMEIGGRGTGGERDVYAKACNQDVDGPAAGGNSFLFSAGFVGAHIDVCVGCCTGTMVRGC